MPEKLEKRFWDKVDRGDEEECWEWQAHTVQGYGNIRGRPENDSKNRNSHRVAYELEHGDVPNDKMILHTCDNRLCVNPGHLYAGDHADNAEDMYERSPPNREYETGEEAANAKLTEKQVKEIKAKMNVKTQPELAENYGVSVSLISKISRGILWEEVE